MLDKVFPLMGRGLWLLGMIVWGCGSGDLQEDECNVQESTQRVFRVKRDGKIAIGGYIGGATVCMDANGNNVCEANEKEATTDTSGGYSLALTTQDASCLPIPMIAYSGVNLEINQTFNGILKASILQENITPLTTMVVVLMDDLNLSFGDANDQVAGVMNLTVEHLDQDPIAYLEDTGDDQLLKAVIGIEKMVEILVRRSREEDLVLHYWKNYHALGASMLLSDNIEQTIEWVAEESSTQELLERFIVYLDGQHLTSQNRHDKILEIEATLSALLDQYATKEEL